MFISDAYAQAAGAPAGDPTGGMLIILPLMLLFMYFFVYRPQAKRAKEHKSLLESLAKGDEVVTAGGMAGKVAEVRENFVKITVADNVDILVQKSAITTVLPKGSLKSA